MGSVGAKKLKIITAYDSSFEELGDLSAKSSRLYAANYGYSFEVYRDIFEKRPPAWSKIFYLIKEIESQKYDYLLWVDADTFFIRNNANILDNLPEEKNIFVVNHMCTIGAINEQPGLHLQAERPNTGVMLVKCNEWSLNFLSSIWDMTEYLNHFWWEQAAFHKLLGFNFEISGGRLKNEINQSLMAHIGWLSGIWNCVPTAANGGDDEPVTKNLLNPVIIHLAGMPNQLRLEKMRSLAEDIWGRAEDIWGRPKF